MPIPLPNLNLAQTAQSGASTGGSKTIISGGQNTGFLVFGLLAALVVIVWLALRKG